MSEYVLLQGTEEHLSRFGLSELPLPVRQELLDSVVTSDRVRLDLLLDELDHFTEWKMNNLGTYVVGLEPANCLVEGRDVDRAAGRLQFLEPGESREVHLEIGVLASAQEIEAFRKAAQG